MALVTTSRYADVTGDTTTSTGVVAQALADAQAQLEEDLGGRLLESAERTELLWPDSQGRLYPRALPVTVPPAGYTVDGATLTGSAPFGPSFVGGTTAAVEVTYTGGFVERSANPTATNRLPVSVEIDVIWAAYRLAHPSTSLANLPAGVGSVRLGDAAMSAIAGRALAVGVQQWSPSTFRLRRRRV